MVDAKLTFIIPTIGRDTLKHTINSMLKQTCPEWKAIIVFDGIEPTLKTDDPRIQIIQSPKLELELGKNRPVGAGHVRNYGIKHATTEWVAFIDDDDTITLDYVECFLEEMRNNGCDLIIFRMGQVLKNDGNGVIVMTLPSPDAEDFIKCDVGISFAVKKSVFDSGIMFETSEYEDFEFLEKVRRNNHKMIISPYVLYMIRYYFEIKKLESAYTRVFINFPICVQKVN